jgi:hypothetical protein
MARRFRRLAVAVLAVALLGITFAGCSSSPPLSANQVLARAINNMLAWKSYKYSGSSTMLVPSDTRLNNNSSFTTSLVASPNGALDGHMVVESPSYSYETYSFNGNEYTRVFGSDWQRVARGATDPGYGMVTADARKIIASFASLVEDVKMDKETSDEYTVSMVMGEKYRAGAAAIAGTLASTVPASGSSKATMMSLVIGRKDLQPRRVYMSDSQTLEAPPSRIRILTRGTYSQVDKPVDVTPPAAALSAPEVSAQQAPRTQQPQ